MAKSKVSFGLGRNVWQALVLMILGASFVAAQTSSPTPAQANQPSAAVVQSTPPSAATGRPPIQTRTKEEFQAYQIAMANEPNPQAMEKAADDFAAKFPNSEVRVLLYRAAMSGYQNIGNPQKMMDMGTKVLAIDKDDPEALIGVAEVLEERTSPTDLDREQREGQVIDYATHALKTIDTDLAVPVGTAPERIQGYKKYLRSTALAILGTIYYKQENFSEAEAKLQNALDADPASPDPVVVLRLTMALDQEKKYPQALLQANHAVELSKEDTDLGRMARRERDKLVAQVGGAPVPTVQENTNPAPAAASPSPQETAPGAPAPGH